MKSKIFGISRLIIVSLLLTACCNTTKSDVSRATAVQVGLNTIVIQDSQTAESNGAVVVIPTDTAIPTATHQIPTETAISTTAHQIPTETAQVPTSTPYVFSLNNLPYGTPTNIQLSFPTEKGLDGSSPLICTVYHVDGQYFLATNPVECPVDQYEGAILWGNANFPGGGQGDNITQTDHFVPVIANQAGNLGFGPLGSPSNNPYYGVAVIDGQSVLVQIITLEEQVQEEQQQETQKTPKPGGNNGGGDPDDCNPWHPGCPEPTQPGVTPEG